MTVDPERAFSPGLVRQMAETKKLFQQRDRLREALMDMLTLYASARLAAGHTIESVEEEPLVQKARAAIGREQE